MNLNNSYVSLLPAGRQGANHEAVQGDIHRHCYFNRRFCCGAHFTKGRM